MNEIEIKKFVSHNVCQKYHDLHNRYSIFKVTMDVGKLIKRGLCDLTLFSSVSAHMFGFCCEADLL